MHQSCIFQCVLVRDLASCVHSNSVVLDVAAADAATNYRVGPGTDLAIFRAIRDNVTASVIDFRRPSRRSVDKRCSTVSPPSDQATDVATSCDNICVIDSC